MKFFRSRAPFGVWWTSGWNWTAKKSREWSATIAKGALPEAPMTSKPVTIADLAEQQLILNPLGCGYRAALQRAMEGAGKQVRLGIDLHGTETQLRLVAAGLGLGLAPTRLLASSHFLKDLCPVEVADFALKLDLWLLRAPELGNLSRALGVLGQVLARTFEIGRPPEAALRVSGRGRVGR